MCKLHIGQTRTAPSTQPLNHVVDLPGRRPLRSAGTNRLAVSPVKLTTVANQPGFPGPRTWNDLPDDVTSVSDLKLACSPNPYSEYSQDWTSPNLSLVDLAVVCIT